MVCCRAQGINGLMKEMTLGNGNEYHPQNELLLHDSHLWQSLSFVCVDVGGRLFRAPPRKTTGTAVKKQPRTSEAFSRLGLWHLRTSFSVYTREAKVSTSTRGRIASTKILAPHGRKKTGYLPALITASMAIFPRFRLRHFNLEFIEASADFTKTTTTHDAA